jgi:pantoate--beta-alanine ligase
MSPGRPLEEGSSAAGRNARMEPQSMRIIHSTRELQELADKERAAGLRIGLVPTMGALHRGHLALVETARERVDRVWVSIFVNPTQFNDAADFDGYPRTFEDDAARCREAGVDVIFAPRPEELYPEGSQTWVEVAGLTDPLCGATRPGHFRGVTTVVSKLLHAAKPHVAVFGEKDFQQLSVIRRMARDLVMDVEIVGAPTVREPDGLALSSRNVHLGPKGREQAVSLVRALDAAQTALFSGERSRERVLAEVREIIERAPQACIDYAELRHPETLELASEHLDGPAVLALAVHFSPDPDGQGSDVRLIDNRVLRLQRD